jgi:hypothetical protein
MLISMPTAASITCTCVGDLLHAAREQQSILDSLRAQLGPFIFSARASPDPN